MYIIWWIVVGLIAGFITGKLMKGSGFGAVMDIVVGIVGAIIGGFIMRSLGYSGSGRHDLHDHCCGNWRGIAHAAYPSCDTRACQQPITVSVNCFCSTALQNDQRHP